MISEREKKLCTFFSFLLSPSIHPFFCLFLVIHPTHSLVFFLFFFFVFSSSSPRSLSGSSAVLFWVLSFLLSLSLLGSARIYIPQRLFCFLFCLLTSNNYVIAMHHFPVPSYHFFCFSFSSSLSPCIGPIPTLQSTYPLQPTQPNSTQHGLAINTLHRIAFYPHRIALSSSPFRSVSHSSSFISLTHPFIHSFIPSFFVSFSINSRVHSHHTPLLLHLPSRHASLYAFSFHDALCFSVSGLTRLGVPTSYFLPLWGFVFAFFHRPSPSSTRTIPIRLDLPAYSCAIAPFPNTPRSLPTIDELPNYLPIIPGDYHHHHHPIHGGDSPYHWRTPRHTKKYSTALRSSLRFVECRLLSTNSARATPMKPLLPYLRICTHANHTHSPLHFLFSSS